jgi:hypothetical protein
MASSFGACYVHVGAAAHSDVSAIVPGGEAFLECVDVLIPLDGCTETS